MMIAKATLFPSTLIVINSEMFELLDCNVDDIFHGRAENVLMSTQDCDIMSLSP